MQPPHLPLAEVKNRMMTDPCAMSRHGFLIIYNALVEPRPAAEIARHRGGTLQGKRVKPMPEQPAQCHSHDIPLMHEQMAQKGSLICSCMANNSSYTS